MQSFSCGECHDCRDRNCEDRTSENKIAGIYLRPSLSWIRGKLRYGLVPMRKKVLAAYIVGSVAKGTEKPESDLDIAVIIEPMKRKSALQFTEAFHQKYRSNDQYPEWRGRRVDFQFFYPDDPELQGYAKIPL